MALTKRHPWVRLTDRAATAMAAHRGGSTTWPAISASGLSIATWAATSRPSMRARAVPTLSRPANLSAKACFEVGRRAGAGSPYARRPVTERLTIILAGDFGARGSLAVRYPRDLEVKVLVDGYALPLSPGILQSQRIGDLRGSNPNI